MDMLTSYGRPTICLMIYGTQSKNIAHYYRPMTDPTGMESVLMAQYNMKQGIKQFGEKGMEALITELRQLDLKRVLEPMNATALSDEEKRMALDYLMFLTEKVMVGLKEEIVLMGANNVHLLKRNKPLPLQYHGRHYYLHVLLMHWKKDIYSYNRHPRCIHACRN
jgi:hypothetical protein